MPPKKKAKISEEESQGDLFRGLGFQIHSSLSHLPKLIFGHGASSYTSDERLLSEINYLIINATDAEAMRNVATEAKSKGIPVLVPQFITDAIASGKIPTHLEDYAVTIPDPVPSVITKPAKVRPPRKGPTPAKVPGKPFDSVVFAISGSLKSMSHMQFKDVVDKLGGTVAGSITLNVQYLVTTKQEILLSRCGGGSKVASARAKNVPIVSEQFVIAANASGDLPDWLDYDIDDDGDSAVPGGNSMAVDYVEAAPSRPVAVASSAPTANKMDVDPAPSVVVPPPKTAAVSAPPKKAPAPKLTAAAAPRIHGAKPFVGVTFAISGTLSQPRKQFEALITKLGGKVAGSVTNKVQYLITTEEELEQGTTKIAAAQEKDVPLVTEQFVLDAEATGELPDAAKYEVGGDGDDGGDDDRDDGEEEEEDEEEDDEPASDQDAPEEIPFDPENCDEDESRLDPGIAPLPAGAPCALLTLAPEVLKIITNHLRYRHIVNLWHTGDQILRNHLSAGIFDLDVNLLKRTDAAWPSNLSFFSDVKVLNVHTPEDYHHMPVAGFDASTLPTSVTALTLAFGNALEFVTSSTTRLIDTFPHLTKLTIQTGTVQTSLTATAHLTLLEGLTEVNVPITVSVHNLHHLPRSVARLSGIALDPVYDAGIISDAIVASALPPNLEQLEISVGLLGGLLLRGVHKSPLAHTLHTLKMTCVAATTPAITAAAGSNITITPEAALIRHDHLMSNVALALLPQNLQSLEIDFGHLGIAPDPEPAESTISLLTRACVATLPKHLTSLVLVQCPFLTRGPQLLGLSRNLTKLHLSPVKFDSADLTQLPGTLTDLVLIKRRERHDEIAQGDAVYPWNMMSETATISGDCLDYLPPKLTRLGLPFTNDLKAKDLRKLPQTLRHLQIAKLAEPRMTKHFPRGLITYEYIDDYQFVNPLLKGLPSGLQSLVSRGMVDWEGDSVKWLCTNLKRLCMSSSNFDEEFMSRIPRTIRDYEIEDGDEWDSYQYLPRNLVRLSVFSQSHMQPEHVADLPPHLTYLRAALDGLRLEDFGRLPRTIGKIVVPRDCVYSAEQVQQLLPPHCQFVVSTERF